ncbi:MAG: hypothetical protein JWN30_791, partial [Bacilli bacterium]|nr:hypothetical protein [Bacilli bacterium]
LSQTVNWTDELAAEITALLGGSSLYVRQE